MKLDKGILTLPTISGLVATIFLLIIMLSYASIKTKSLITKRNNDVFTTTSMNAFDFNYVFDYTYGLDFAIALARYGSNQDIFDETIGELSFVAYEWGMGGV